MGRETMTKKDRLDQIRRKAEDCRGCGLQGSRDRLVFGEGDAGSAVMLVGEAPGKDEDRTGSPFVGRSGRLLTDLLSASGIARENVYIANILKCRPPGNRKPSRGEALACMPYLREQISVVSPRVIICLGATSMGWLLGDGFGKISTVRGRMIRSEDASGEMGLPPGTLVMATFHPSYLLRNPSRGAGRPTDLVLSDLAAAASCSISG